MEVKATCRVHWPTGPVDVCLEHARQLVALGKALGTYVYSEEIAGIDNCKNCEKETENSNPSLSQ